MIRKTNAPLRAQNSYSFNSLVYKTSEKLHDKNEIEKRFGRNQIKNKYVGIVLRW